MREKRRERERERKDIYIMFFLLLEGVTDFLCACVGERNEKKGKKKEWIINFFFFFSGVTDLPKYTLRIILDELKINFRKVQVDFGPLHLIWKLFILFFIFRFGFFFDFYSIFHSTKFLRSNSF